MEVSRPILEALLDLIDDCVDEDRAEAAVSELDESTIAALLDLNHTVRMLENRALRKGSSILMTEYLNRITKRSAVMR